MKVRKVRKKEEALFSKLYEDILWESFDYRDKAWKRNAIKNWTKDKVEERIKFILIKELL